MILFHNVVEIFHLSDADGSAVLLVVTFDRGFIGLTGLDGNLLGHTMSVDGFLQEPERCLFIPVLGKQLPLPMLNFSEHPWTSPAYTRLCTKKPTFPQI